jgi:hypothetical protein
MTRLEDEIARLREEIEALSIYSPPVQIVDEEMVRMMPVVDSLLKGDPVPDELLTPEVKRVAKELEPYVDVFREMEEEGFFGPYPDDEAEPSSTRS